MLLGTQDKDFFPKDMIEKFRFMKEMGFECFEIDGKVLVENLEEVKKAIKETGLPVCTACGGYRGWIGDFIEEKRLNGIEDLKEILRALKEVGGTGVVVPAAWGMFTFRLPPMVSPRSHGYPIDYRGKEFAADDDSNGPLFFLRALEDSGKGAEIEAQDVAEALLNYAPFEHGFFWWGGYGVSTEHTAYLNLRNGITAPRSGSIEQNGHVAAEQIGGQIFIDTWGLVTPGNPDLAAKLAQKAASVTHDRNGIYGGIFVAVCISYAFVEKDISKIIEKALSYLPADCEYARVVRAVMNYFESYGTNGDWEACYRYIFEHYGYDKYQGVCHIIPNIAVMILALLYGKGDFDDTLNICNRCGWDTDCNVGNLGTIMGVRGGLDAIDYEKWRRPIHDFLVCSGVVGSLNIMDIPYAASYIAKQAAALQ